MLKAEYQEIIQEYKEQVRNLRAQISELEDAGNLKMLHLNELYKN